MLRTLRAAVMVVLIALFALQPASLALASSHTAAVRQFSDVPQTHPDYGHIMFLAKHGLINGYPDGRFGPSDSLTRAAAAKIAIQVAGHVERKTGQPLAFSDVPTSHWAVSWIRAGVETSLVLGFENRTFRPDEPVTRAQLAALALRAARQDDSKVPSLSISDIQPSDWFHNAAVLAVAADMMELKDGNFRPNQVATRAEAARAFAQAMIFTPRAFSTPLEITVDPQRGQVEVAGPGSEEFQPVTAVTAVKEGSRIRTAAASAANISFPDGSALYVDNLSELIIRRSRGAQFITATGVEELDVELVRGNLFTNLTPRLSPEEVQAYGPTLARFNDREADARAARAMEPRIRAAQSHTGQNLPSDATRLLIFSNPGSLEPGDTQGAEITIVLANDAGEPVTASGGDVNLELLTDVGAISNTSPVIPNGFQAVVVSLVPPADEPADAKTRITAVAGEVTSSLTIPTSKVSWWQGLFTKKVRATVRMPWSVASVRGTVANFKVDAKKNEANTLNGDVTLENPVTGDKEEVKANQSSKTEGPTEPPSNPEPLSSEVQKDFSAQQTWINEQQNKAIENADERQKQAAEADKQVVQNLVQALPKDTVNPSIAISSPSNGTRSGLASITVSGRATDDVKLASVTVGGSSASVDVDGNWSATVALQPGNNTITATATDGSGNTGSTSVQVTFDAAAPSITLSGPTVTRERQATVTGSALAPGGLRSASLNGQPISVEQNGSFSVRVELQAGANLLEAVVTDQQDRTARAEVQITSASVPPLLSINPIELTTGKPEVAISGSAAAKYAKLKSVSVGGSSVLFGADGSFQSIVKLKLGDNPVVVEAEDEAGNKTSETVTIKFDAAAPTVRFTRPKDGLITKDASIQVHVVATAAAGIRTLTVNGQPVSVDARGQGVFTVDLQEGENILLAEIEEQLGRKASSSRRVYRLSKPPTLILTQPEAGRAAKREIAVAGSAAAAFGPLASVTVNGGTMILGSAGDFTTSVRLNNGENTITAEATDTAGNKTTVTRQVTFVPTAPILTVTAPAEGLITRTETVTVSGTVENRDEVQEVTINGVSAPVSATTGAFSATVRLSPGKNTLTVALPAAVGGASESRTVVYANLPPSLSLTSPPDNFTSARPNVIVSGSALTSYGTPAKVSINGLVTSVSSSGAFNATITLRPNVPTPITVEARDDADNATATTRTVTFKPAVPLITVTEPTTGSVTNRTSVTVRGSVTSPIKIAFVEVNGASATLNADGGFSATVDLKPGLNTITVTAGDEAKGTSSTTLTVTRGGVPPTVTIGSPSEGFTSGRADLAVSGSAAAAASTIRMRSVTVNGSGATLDAAGNWAAQVTLVAGENTLTIVATDELGATATASRKVTFAQGVPTLEVSSPADGTVTRDASVEVRGRARSSTPTQAVTVNGNTVSTGADGSFQLSVPLQSGPNNVTVTVTDSLNRSTSTTRRVIRADRPPVINISAPAEGAEVPSPTVDVAGTVTAMEGVRLTSVTVNGVSVGTSGNFATTVTLPNEGANTITVSAIDSAGNSTTVTRQVRWVLAPLSVTIASPTTPTTVRNTDKVTVSGEVRNAQGQATVTVNGVSATVPPGGGSFSVEITLQRGNNSISAQATDSRNRTASATGPTVAFDPVPPSLSVSWPFPEGAVVATASQVVSGSVSTTFGPASVTVNGSGVSVGANGSFSANVTIGTTLTTITVTAADRYGAVSASRSATLVPPVVVQPLPTISFTSPANNSGTNAAQVDVTGSYTAAAGLKSLTVANDATPTTTISVQTTTTGFSAPVPLNFGTNVITAVVTDNQDRSATATLTVNVAVSPQTSAIAASPTVLPPDGASTATITVQLKDSAGTNLTTGGASVELSATQGTIDSVTDNGNGTYTGVYTAGAAPGTATISGTINGTSMANSATVTMGTVPTLTQPAAITYTRATSIGLAGTAAPVAKLKVYVDGVGIPSVEVTAGDAGAFSAEVPLPSSDGIYEFVIRDVATHLASAPVNVIVDRTAPVLTIQGLALPAASVTVSGSYTERNPDKVEIVVDSGTPALAAIVSGGTDTGTYSLTGVAIPESAGTISVVMTDKAGNTTTRTITYDNTATTQARMRLVARSVPAVSGTELLVDVFVENVPANLGSATAEIRFDTPVLTLQSADAGPLLGGTGAQQVFLHDNSKGIAQFAISNPHGAASGSSLLATFRFAVSSASETTVHIGFYDVSQKTGGSGVLMLDLAEQLITNTAQPIDVMLTVTPQ